jgi:hypothetical protein
MKGGEVVLPKYVHFHLTLLVNSPRPKIHALRASFIPGICYILAIFDRHLQGRF